MLRVNKISKTFKDSRRTLDVLKGIDFEVEGCETIAVLGPTGCGKSTLLRLIADLDQPSNGEILFDGELSPHKNIVGMVFQSPTLLPWKTLIENVELPIQLSEAESDYRVKMSVSDIIRSVGLDGFEDYYPSEISGGMQARTALARALVLRPSVLLLDEPFASIDALTRFSLCKLLVKVFNEFNSSAILVTHSINDAALLANRVLILSSLPASIVGSVIIDLPKEVRLQEPEHPQLINARMQIRELLKKK